MPISPSSAIHALLLGIRTTNSEDLKQNLEKFAGIIENQNWSIERSETLRKELERFRLHFIDDRENLKEILDCREDDAQEWLDLLQLVLPLDLQLVNENVHSLSEQVAEYPDSKAFRTSVFDIMIYLSRRTGLHPRCLTIQNIQKLGQRAIASGGYGDVWKGRASGRFVCLKILRATAEPDIEQILKDYMREAIVWRQLNHPNLLPFMGIFHLDDDSKLCLVSPWMENGNLRQYLKKANLKDVKHDLLVRDVAFGLAYLHEKKFVHGDLKGDNVLITADFRACIADFGLSRISETQRLIQSSCANSNVKGTIRWTAPELFQPRSVASRESDVYAFGSVCYEIYSGNVPFWDRPDLAVMLAIISHERPSRPEERPGDMTWKIIETCWNPEPSYRPTMPAVIEQLAMGGSPHTHSWEPNSTQMWNTLHLESTRVEPELPAWRLWTREIGMEEVPLVPPEEVFIWKPVLDIPQQQAHTPGRPLRIFYKMALNNYCQSRGYQHRFSDTIHPGYCESEVYVEGSLYGRGEGKTVIDAQQSAAYNALSQMHLDGHI